MPNKRKNNQGLNLLISILRSIARDTKAQARFRLMAADRLAVIDGTYAVTLAQVEDDPLSPPQKQDEPTAPVVPSTMFR